MENNTLLSVGQLCNVGYYITFKIDGVTIFKDEGKAILKGRRDLGKGWWLINLHKDKPQLPIASANNVYELHNTGALVNYLHKSLFIPTKSAFIKAVKQGHITTWPGLTEDVINNHLKMTPVTTMGHLNHKIQHIRSTNKEMQGTSDLEDAAVTPAGTGEKTYWFYEVVIDQGQIYTDLT
jgi:hypothetical protein